MNGVDESENIDSLDISVVDSQRVAQTDSFEETEWDPVEFDLKKSINPKWKSNDNNNNDNDNNKPKRIQDIRLIRLDSGSDDGKRKTADADDDGWPYEEPASPCALFGAKINMSSAPPGGFKGEFSSGDPEWDDQSKKSTGSNTRERSSSRSSQQQSQQQPRKSSSSSSSRRLLHAQQQLKQQEQQQQQQHQQEQLRRRRQRQRQQEKLQQQQQQQQEEENEGEDDDDHDDDGASYELECGSRSGSEDEDEEEKYSDESEQSVTDSPTYEDDNPMVTPAMGKAKGARKKPPTLKRGAHQVATPSIVRAMKDKQAFAVSDDEDDGNFDFEAELDSDMDSLGSGHSRNNRGENGAKSKQLARLGAANASFRRASMSKKKEFVFDRSRNAADLKAARKANNSFKGHTDMNRSFSVVEAKRPLNRTISRREKMQNSFTATSGGAALGSVRTTLSSSQEGSSTRKIPSRAKSLGNPTAGATKLKSALSKFSESVVSGSLVSASVDAPPSAAGASGKKTYGATLSALKVLSGADGTGVSKAGGEGDLKSAIMQQVFRSSSLMELQVKPKPKISKASSVSSGMARAAAASGEMFQPKEQVASKDDNDAKPAPASSDAKPAPTRPRRHKSTAPESSATGGFHESLGRIRKSKMADASERSQKSAQSAGSSVSRSQKSAASDLDAAGSGHTSRRSMQRSGSGRQLKESSARAYDASPQRASGTNVIVLLKKKEPITDSQMMQKGNRQMFHALMYETKLGIDMEKLRQKVEGGSDDDDSASETSK